MAVPNRLRALFALCAVGTQKRRRRRAATSPGLGQRTRCRDRENERTRFLHTNTRRRAAFCARGWGRAQLLLERRRNTHRPQSICCCIIMHISREHCCWWKERGGVVSRARLVRRLPNASHRPSRRWRARRRFVSLPSILWPKAKMHCAASTPPPSSTPPLLHHSSTATDLLRRAPLVPLVERLDCDAPQQLAREDAQQRPREVERRKDRAVLVRALCQGV